MHSLQALLVAAAAALLATGGRCDMETAGERVVVANNIVDFARAILEGWSNIMLTEHLDLTILPNTTIDGAQALFHNPSNLASLQVCVSYSCS